MTTAQVDRVLTTTNFILPFVGFAIITALFMPEDTRAVEWVNTTRNVTVPYRMFALLLSLTVLFFHRNDEVEWSTALKLLLVYWVILLIRMFYDLQIRTDIYVNQPRANMTWIWTILITFIPMLSVIKSYKSLDLELITKTLGWLYLFLIPTLFITSPMLMADSSELEERIGGNLALNTITLGHIGVSVCLFFICKIKQGGQRQLLPLYVMLIAAALLIMLRAASRGPMVTFIFCLAFFLAAQQKQISISIFLVMIFGVLLITFSDQILLWMKDVSPVLADRMKETLQGRMFDERKASFAWAWQHFIDYPFLGYAFAVFNKDGTFWYSHNMILDSFMGMGLIGGILILVIYGKLFFQAWVALRENHRYTWIYVIAMQQIVAGMFSGGFYESDLLSLMLAASFMTYSSSHSTA